MPSATILEIPGAGHGPFVKKPAFCASVLSEFFSDAGPGRVAHAAKIWLPKEIARSVSA